MVKTIPFFKLYQGFCSCLKSRLLSLSQHIKRDCCTGVVNWDVASIIAGGVHCKVACWGSASV